MIREIIRKSVNDAFIGLGIEPVDFNVEKPNNNQADYSVNAAFLLSKKLGRGPKDVAEMIVSEIHKNKPEEISEIEVVNGYINFFLSQSFLQDQIAAIHKKSSEYGRSNIGKDQKVIIEYSQPNIAKPLHAGHLRNTLLGDALANIYDFLGYKVTRWNYLGDWGTQFGKVIAAYKRWSNEERIKTNPIGELSTLYIRFNQEARLDPKLDEIGREEFKKLEDGDEENRRLWKWFRKETPKSLEKVYHTLGVKFDVDIGESFYEKELTGLVKRLADDSIAEVGEEGALIINLDKYGLPPGLIRKSDGASLYLTRDIANLEYRLQKYKPNKILYIVDVGQSLHFRQLFAIANILKLNRTELVHVSYGLVLGEDKKKLSSRGGNAITFDDMVAESVKLADKVVREKNPDMSESDYDKISKTVGVGALKYIMLKDNNSTDIVFDWDKMLDFNGNSGPYLQYSYARIHGILRRVPRDGDKADISLLTETTELDLIKHLIDLPDVLVHSAQTYLTSNLALYLYELSDMFNKFYELVPIMKDDNPVRRNARLILVEAVAETLKTGLNLLGIDVLEKI